MCGREGNHHGLWSRQVGFEMNLEGWVEKGERALRNGKDKSNMQKSSLSTGTWSRKGCQHRPKEGQKLRTRQGIGGGCY